MNKIKKGRNINKKKKQNKVKYYMDSYKPSPDPSNIPLPSWNRKYNIINNIYINNKSFNT